MDKARIAADMAKNETIFGKILRGEIPCNKVYEDDYILAFHDIAPKAKVHALVIPKRQIVDIASSTPEDAEMIGYILTTIPKIAEELGVQQSGYRIISNNGKDSAPEVPHLHFHILGGEKLADF